MIIIDTSSQMSFRTPSKGPDEEQLYPYHFHIVPSISLITLGIANFISYHEFGWKKVVIITQDQDYYKRVLHYIVFSIAAALELHVVTIDCQAFQPRPSFPHIICADKMFHVTRRQSTGSQHLA